MVDIRGFNKGMDMDSAPELLANGAYTYAMNVSNGSEGIVNLPGNRLIDGFPANANPGNEWILGSFFDKVRQRIIYFTNHERGFHRILSYLVPSIENPNGAYIVLFEDTNGVFSEWPTSTLFDPNYLIKDIKVIHREHEGDLYYFIDPVKKLRKFNYDSIQKIRDAFTPVCATGWTDGNYTGTLLRDGTPIPQVVDDTIWNNLTTPAWCYYNNDPANDAIYGKLYNWYAVSHPLFAPAGYRVTTDADFNNLATCLGGVDIAGGKMKSTSNLWAAPNTGATNESFFNGLPGGFRFRDGTFLSLGVTGVWWTSTEIGTNNAWLRNLIYDNASIIRTNVTKTFGCSVRLIKQQ